MIKNLFKLLLKIQGYLDFNFKLFKLVIVLVNLDKLVLAN